MPRYHALDVDDLWVRTVALRSADDFLKHPVVTELPEGHPDRSQACQISITYEDTDHHLVEIGAVRLIEAKLGDRGGPGKRWDGERFVDGPRPLAGVHPQAMLDELRHRGLAAAEPAPALPAAPPAAALEDLRPDAAGAADPQT